MRSLVHLALILLILTPMSLNARQKVGGGTFAPFWLQFKSAVARNDKEAVASMTKLPLMFENKERSRAEFIKIYDLLFVREVRKCFANGKPVKDGDTYELFCGQQIFYFGRVDGEYKFLEFGVND